MANMLSWLTSGTGTQVNSIVSLVGIPGVPYSELKKSTISYSNAVTEMNTIKALNNASLTPYRVNAITVIHGESDEQNDVTDSTYAGYLAEWQKDFETDAKAITGQDGLVPLFLCQMASWPIYSKIVPHTAIGQWIAAKANPQKIFLVAPKYMLDYSDGVHLNNYSYRRLGEYYAKVMKKVLIDKQPWLPLSPQCITIDSTTIIAKFHVPSPPLQFDVSAVMAKTNYGFEYFDTDNSATIAKVELLDSIRVKITLDKKPTGAQKQLAYAYTALDIGTYAGRNDALAPKGNLSDSDTLSAFYNDANVPVSMGNKLKNWCISFIEPISEPLNKTLTVTSCGSYNLNGNVYTKSGIYTQNVTSKNGCDSAITLQLTVNYVDTSLTVNETTVLSNAQNASYSWIDCSTKATIVNAINNSYVVTATGDYAAIVSQNSCVDTSRCVHVTAANDYPQTIILNEGWNLISFNILPIDQTIETVFKDVLPDLIEIKNQESFWSGGQVALFNSLKTISDQTAYLIKMKSKGSITVRGFKSTYTIGVMKPGWNLVGCPYQTSKALSILFNTTNCTAVKSFEGFWIPGAGLNSITNLDPGKGYFVEGK
jgi:hypothetical protein